MCASAALADDSGKSRPARFAIIFNMGYAGDHLPKDKGEFEKLIATVKSAHFNVVLCKYEDWRAAICKTHDVKIMVDLLTPEHHVYKNVGGAEKLCESLRGNDVVWGYHLWSDRIGGTVAGRSRDIANVKRWDPTHAAYVGSYNARGVGDLKNPDAIGYYDFHWRRGGHWRHLLRVSDAARKTNSYFLRYCQPDPGQVGKGNYNRGLYTITTSIAFGLKGYMYHFRGSELDRKTWKLNALGDDLAKINAQVAPLGVELMKIGNPVAVFSTPVTKTAKDRPTGQEKPAVPQEFKPVPDDHWFAVKSGEFLVGEFPVTNDFAALFCANHNSYQTQSVSLTFSKTVKSVEHFDRKTGKWMALKAVSGAVAFSIPPATGELIRIRR